MRVSNVDKHTKEGELPVRLCNYVDVYKNDRITQQITFMPATASPDEIERFRLHHNDVLITKDSETWNDIGVPALVTEPSDDLISGYHLAILRPKAGIYGPYLFWALQSKPAAYQFHVEAKGVTRYGLSHNGIQSVTLLIPPPEEQAAIVRFLDHADEQIQRYIAAKGRLIALLEEQRQAVVHQAVTRGLDPSVRLKPSGVEWMGDVPEHWAVRRLKSLASIGTGDKDTINRNEEGKYPFFVRSQNVERIDTWSFDGEAVLTAGDGAGVGKVFHYIDGRFDFHQRVYKFSDFREICGKFFYYGLKASLPCHTQQGTAKSTVDSLRLPMLQNIGTPVPPIQEQQEITEYLERVAQEIEVASCEARRQIDLMNEYRARLIADVVTGQLDVREAAAQLQESS